jgi:hypothetical protein
LVERKFARNYNSNMEIVSFTVIKILATTTKNTQANATTSAVNTILSCTTTSKEAIKAVSNSAEQLNSQPRFILSPATVEDIDDVVASIVASTDAIDKNQISANATVTDSRAGANSTGSRFRQKSCATSITAESTVTDVEVWAHAAEEVSNHAFEVLISVNANVATAGPSPQESSPTVESCADIEEDNDDELPGLEEGPEI